MDILSLFSGIGGLDIGVHRALERLGIEGRTRAYVEGEAFSVGVLARAMEAGALAPAPVWSDVRTFGAATCPGPVDMVIGGFPCQDLSSAGKREGIRGERSGLFFELARIVRELEPRYVFMENVRGITVRGIDAVLGELARLGFDAEWGCLQAAQVGAPHKRERWFCLAYRDVDRIRDVHRRRDGQGGEGSPKPSQNGEDMVHADSPRLSRRLEPIGEGADEEHPREAGAAVADCHRGRQQRQRWPEQMRQVQQRDKPHGCYEAAWPPGPDDRDGWRRYLKRFPSLEPAVCRGPDGIPYRVDRLRALGNAVVPKQAEAAFLLLWRRAHDLF